MEGEVVSMGTSIVSTITGAITEFATGVAGTVVEVFNAVCVNEAGGLSNLAIWGLVLGGIALATAIVRKFTAKV